MGQPYLICTTEMQQHREFFLGKVCKSLPTCLRKQLYQSLVLPHLDYYSVVCTECSRADVKKLEGILKRGMRQILQERWDCPSDTMRKKLGWSSLASKRNMLRLMTVKRCMSGRCPHYLKGFFVTNNFVSTFLCMHCWYPIYTSHVLMGFPLNIA